MKVVFSSRPTFALLGVIFGVAMSVLNVPVNAIPDGNVCNPGESAGICNGECNGMCGVSQATCYFNCLLVQCAPCKDNGNEGPAYNACRDTLLKLNVVTACN